MNLDAFPSDNTTQKLSCCRFLCTVHYNKCYVRGGCVAETDNQTQHGHKVLNVTIHFIFYMNYCDAAPQTMSE